MTGASDPATVAAGLPLGCGYACPDRDLANGTCERHGPTEIDLIVSRTTAAFRDDLRAIMQGDAGTDEPICLITGKPIEPWAKQAMDRHELERNAP